MPCESSFDGAQRSVSYVQSGGKRLPALRASEDLVDRQRKTSASKPKRSMA